MQVVLPFLPISSERILESHLSLLRGILLPTAFQKKSMSAHICGDEERDGNGVVVPRFHHGLKPPTKEIHHIGRETCSAYSTVHPHKILCLKGIRAAQILEPIHLGHYPGRGERGSIPLPLPSGKLTQGCTDPNKLVGMLAANWPASASSWSFVCVRSWDNISRHADPPLQLSSL